MRHGQKSIANDDVDQIATVRALGFYMQAMDELEKICAVVVTWLAKAREPQNKRADGLAHAM